MVATIVAFERLALDRVVAGKVGHAQYAAALPAAGDDQPRRLATIEAARAILGHDAQHAREVLLHQPLACGVGLSVAQVRRAGRRVLPEILRAFGQEPGIALIEHEAARGEVDSRGHELGSRPRAELRACEFETRDRAGHTRRQVPTRRQARYGLAGRIEIHGARGGSRGRLAKIDERLAPIGHADQHEAPAAQIARLWKGHRQRVGGRHRRVDRVAAAPEHIDARLAREAMRGNHHAVLRSFRHGCRPQAGASRQRERQEHGQCRSIHAHERLLKENGRESLRPSRPCLGRGPIDQYLSRTLAYQNPPLNPKGPPLRG